MRINLDAEAPEASKKGKGTRGQRAAEHAYNRLKNRHVERDYFGRPVTDAAWDEQGRSAPSVSETKGGTRLDAWLVANGHAASREKAKALIASGAVSVNGSNKVKGSTVVLDNSRVEVSMD